MDKFRNILKILFNIVMTIILYISSLLTYYYIIPLPMLGLGVIPIGHSLLFNMSIGAFCGLLGMIAILVCLFIPILLSILVYKLFSSIFNSIFDTIFPNKSLSDQELRDMKIEDVMESNILKRYIKKIKRLR